MDEHKNEDIMALLAEVMEKHLNGRSRPKRWGFALFVFPLNDKERRPVSYISNGKRAEVFSALKGLITRWEKGDYKAQSTH